MRSKVLWMVMVPVSAVLLSLTPAAGAAPAGLWVEPSQTNGIPARIDAFAVRAGSSYVYQLYLPGCADTAACFLSWDGGMPASVSGTDYDSGSCPVPSPGETVTYSFNDSSAEGDQTSATYKVTTYQGSPAVAPVFIEINESGDNPTIGQMDDDSAHNVTCSGRINIGGSWWDMPKIKGRGNSTWWHSDDKKPYNITLSRMICFPGISSGATRKWSFLAEPCDHSLLRNRAGLHLACELGIGMDTASADVWMNGEYQGCYTVTPKTDSFIPGSGFLIEQDNRKEPAVALGGDPQFKLKGVKEMYEWGTFYNRITVKKMGDDLLMKNGAVDGSHINMIKTANLLIRPWIQDAWDAIRSDTGYNAKGRYYTDYIDMVSFARMYLLQEYVKSYDLCAGSLFFQRRSMADDDKLMAGPVWDLDNALGSTQRNKRLGSADDRSSGDRRSGEGDFIALYDNESHYRISIYRMLSKHEDFMEEVRSQYNEKRKAFDDLPADTARMIDEIDASARMNHIKVKDLASNDHRYSSDTTLGTGQYRQKYLATLDSASDWDAYTANLMTFITTRSLWFRNHFR